MSVTAKVIDETLLSESGSGGTTWETNEVEVIVRGVTDPAKAVWEAKWRARMDANGEVESIEHVRTEGPMNDGHFLVTLVIRTQRSW